MHFVHKSREELRQSKYWLGRAERARADAEKTTDLTAKAVLRGFAEGYQKMAKRVETTAKR